MKKILTILCAIFAITIAGCDDCDSNDSSTSEVDASMETEVADALADEDVDGADMDVEPEEEGTDAAEETPSEEEPAEETPSEEEPVEEAEEEESAEPSEA